MKINSLQGFYHPECPPRLICEAPDRADNGNRQENPPKYYHSVRGDFDGLTECGSWMCPEEESTFADTNE